MRKLQEYNQKVRTSKKMADLRAGDVVRVSRKIKEGEKERTQIFEGIVISVKGKQSSSPTITVRRVSFGVGIEMTIPILSPVVEKIEVVKKAKTRKAKLYYLRRGDFKASKLKMKELDQYVSYEEEPEEKESEEKKEDAESKKGEKIDEKKETVSQEEKK